MLTDVGEARRAPILVLGVGNVLLRDDGVGLVLLEEVKRIASASDDIEFVDGGTQGLALLGVLEERAAALILDAVALGSPAGTVHVIRNAAEGRGSRSTSAHGSSVGELLAIAELLGQLPRDSIIVGIEPGEVRTGVGLSPEVARAVAGACGEAVQALNAMKHAMEPSRA